MSELPKTFDPKAIEERWYAHWEERGLFRPERPDATPWTIVMPPPNVTGSLHIGHALDNTLQDVLTRRERMLGKDAMWVVGMDHAGIATQMVVERQLEERQDKRTNYSREEFVAKVWEWKEESGGAITRQLRRLGASCDWAHERFTMDEPYQRAVTHTFVELHKRGLVYRDKRLVNWDPKFQTAISDLEVETPGYAGQVLDAALLARRRRGRDPGRDHPARNDARRHGGRGAPDDKRYKKLVGKQVKHPITGRLIPIVADEHADPELGSGAVKITPGHDFNDFEVGNRAGFKPADMLNMFDATAHVVQTSDGLIPEELLGLTREDARKRVVELLEARGRFGLGRGSRHPDPLRRPFGRGGRAVADRPMVCERQATRREGDGCDERGRNPHRPRDMEEDLVQLAREHPAVVRLAPAVVGPPDSGLVRRRRDRLRRRIQG